MVQLSSVSHCAHHSLQFTRNSSVKCTLLYWLLNCLWLRRKIGRI